MKIELNNHHSISISHSQQQDPYDIDLKIDFRPVENFQHTDGTASATCRGTCDTCGVTFLGTCDCYA